MKNAKPLLSISFMKMKNTMVMWYCTNKPENKYKIPCRINDLSKQIKFKSTGEIFDDIELHSLQDKMVAKKDFGTMYNAFCAKNVIYMFHDTICSNELFTPLKI